MTSPWPLELQKAPQSLLGLALFLAPTSRPRGAQRGSVTSRGRYSLGAAAGPPPRPAPPTAPPAQPAKFQELPVERAPGTSTARAAHGAHEPACSTPGRGS